MTGVALRGGLRVCRTLAMAVGTHTNDAAVIHIHRQPVDRIVTILTGVPRRDVPAGFTRCRHPVVATDTITGNQAMVHLSGVPGTGIVAFAALGGGGDMGRALAGRTGAVVAGTAYGTRQHIVMIHGRVEPTERGVTILTAVVGRQVSDRFTGSIRTVVTGNTVTHDRAVIHLGT